jgi:hypothetical protein
MLSLGLAPRHSTNLLEAPHVEVPPFLFPQAIQIHDPDMSRGSFSARNVQFLYRHRERVFLNVSQNKQTPWPLVRERTIPTERLVDEI